MKATGVPVFVLGFFVATAAQAGNLCLDASTPPNPPTMDRPTIILREFKFPKKNKRKPFAGVISTSIPSRPRSVTGSACTSFDGGNVTFTILASLVPAGLGPGDEMGDELRYVARVTPTGKSDGTGVGSRFEPGATGTFPVTAFECHNAFPDNL
jgi:hypothetical protein